MNATVKIVAYGSLRRTIPVSAGSGRDHPLAGARTLADVLAALDVGAEQVQLVMVNHRAVGMDVTVRAGDRIALFPREYPIFVDWHAYRRSART